MSWVEVRERVRDSPARAFSLLTVRAAISSARPSLLPRSSWLSLMCSYCLARLVPFFTPRGGMTHLQKKVGRVSRTRRLLVQTAALLAVLPQRLVQRSQRHAGPLSELAALVEV